MCCIIGTTGNHTERVKEALLRLQYRGPDATGVFSDGVVTLGHNRLSIIDLDARSNQPFFSADGTIAVVYNGEIYNFHTLKQELLANGYAFRTESDTEVLVYAYTEWGERFVERLEGMFAFVVYDTSAQKIFLYTDHASIKPLVYATKGKELVFGSEMKAVASLLQDAGTRLEINVDALDTYYALGHIPAPYTMCTGIRKLAPATYLSYEIATGDSHVLQYDPYAHLQPTTVEAAIDHAVAAHLLADVPVGIFFSGGTDSSLIAALLKKQGVNVSAFCLEIIDRPEDSQYAEQIAQHLGISYEHVPFDVSAFDAIYDEVTSRIDEPFADSSLFPTYYIAKHAKKKVTVVLSGEGGDEYFFGYPRSTDLVALRRARMDVTVGLLDRLFFAVPPFKGKNKCFERLFVLARKPISFYLLTMSPAKSLLSLAQWRKAKKAIGMSASEPLWLDASLYLPNDLLRKGDLATMYASLEGRVPLLDKHVLAAAKEAATRVTQLPVLKPVLKKILAGFVPSELVYRKKTGFGLRTKSYMAESRKLPTDLDRAIAYLRERNLLRIDMPSKDRLVRKYPNVCWQLLFLYHSLKNIGL